MERESFEDQEVADFLNKHFVSIKVDREERPDIDHIYMTVCQAMTGHGGWPLTVFLTPDKKPFFAGTYFPKESRGGYPGLLKILERIAAGWREQRDDLIATGEKLVEVLRQEADTAGDGDVDADIVHKAYKEFRHSFDEVYGGFGWAPKFPTPHNLIFLTRYWQETVDKKALAMVEKTLLAMAKGGIYDQIGFGFSRYSTDKKWLVPHFEKMLYDNALLAYAYLEAYQATKNETFAEIAREVFTYVLRDMTSPEGGFYSAEDADSEGEEGKFYVWSPEEVIEVLGKEVGKEYCRTYDIKPGGNFEGKSIPNLIRHDDQAVMEIKKTFTKAGEQLFAAREKRVHPYKDDKILTAWNGLMVAALAKGASVLKEPDYTRAAAKAVNFIYEKLFTKERRLLARYRDGEAAYPGYVDDYAFLIWGLLELYQATFTPEYLVKALELNCRMIDLFWDEENGGLYMYGSDSEQLIARPKEFYDGATPSGNSVAALNFLRLARLTGERSLEEIAHRQLRSYTSKVDRYPMGYSFFLLALLYREYSREIVIVGEKEAKDTQAMLEVIKGSYLPQSEILFVQSGDSEISKIVPMIRGYRPIGGKTTAYVCQQFACQEPTTEVEQLKKMLH